LAEGSVDRVLLGSGAQRLLSSREILLIDLDQRLGHLPPPSPPIYPMRAHPDIFTCAAEDAGAGSCGSIVPAAGSEYPGKTAGRIVRADDLQRPGLSAL